MAEGGVAVLVLAGGEGRRIGGDKPLRILAGAPLIDRALRAAHVFGAPVGVGVRNNNQVDAPRDVEKVIDSDGAAGPLASLIAGLHWARARHRALLLTLPCDAPFLPGDLARRLRAQIESANCAAAIPRTGGRRHPACAMWRTSVEDRVADYIATGGRSLNGFAAFVGGEVVDWADASPDPFFNVNTAQDLELAAAFVAQPHLE